MNRRNCMSVLKGCLLATGLLTAAGSASGTVINIDFNAGVDDFGISQGDLRFFGTDGFQVIFTDDDSNGPSGGDADGVHINNINFGNDKVGDPTDFVLGAFNSFSGANNLHSSGIVANFNQGATLVSFDDTDNDGTVKALFAFDETGTLIAQSAFASQIPVIVEAPTTGIHAGKKIFSVEFDTLAGTAGGSDDGTVFTIDNFHAEGVDPDNEIELPGFDPVPEPGTLALFGFGLAGLVFARRRKTK